MIIGMDLSNSHVGLCAIPGEPGLRAPRPPSIMELTHFNAHGSERVEETANRVIDRVEEWTERHGIEPADCHLMIERPPLSGKKDEEHGSQANVGFTLGQLVGGVRVPLARMGYRTRLAEVGAWRDHMILASNAWGVAACYPQRGQVPIPIAKGAGIERVDLRRSDDGTLHVVWKGCEHRRRITLEELPRFRFMSCPTCEIDRAYPRRKADRIRDAWKELACLLTQAHAPGSYALVVEDARSRAKNKGQPDWRLVGVHDACESFWVACSALDIGGDRATTR